jgi:hypothetical protein
LYFAFVFFFSVFASCLVKTMSRFLGAARNEVFHRCPRWHYLAALILTRLSNDSSLRHGVDGCDNDASLVTVTLATSVAAACGIDFAGNLELLAHLLTDAS